MYAESMSLGTTGEGISGLERVLGEYGDDGRLMIVTGGLHGNEPAGVLALQRVLSRLEERRPRARGRLVALSGNHAALARNVRYVDRDMNRIWCPSEIIERNQSGAGDLSEESEQRVLLAEIQARVAAARGPVFFLDLHSTSAPGAPFAILGDTLQNREIGFAFGIPVILGLEENVHCTLLEFFGEQGHVAVGVEGGSHTDPSTVDHHEAIVWIALVAAGILSKGDVPELEAYRARLASASKGMPTVLEIQYRYDISNGEEFRMEPGFTNFQAIEKGRLLAYADGREVRAEAPGVLLMPRYQGQGREGFFLTRRVRPFWLRVSALLRGLNLGGVLPLLPGVRRHNGDAHTLAVDRRVARWYRRDIFHLFGYRRMHTEGDVRIFTKRVE
jgi:succinylglutamate desuccinylase